MSTLYQNLSGARSLTCAGRFCPRSISTTCLLSRCRYENLPRCNAVKTFGLAPPSPAGSCVAQRGLSQWLCTSLKLLL